MSIEMFWQISHPKHLSKICTLFLINQHYVASTVFPAITLLSSTKYMNLAVISSNFNSSQVLLNGESLGSQTWTRINSDDGSSNWEIE